MTVVPDREDSFNVTRRNNRDILLLSSLLGLAVLQGHEKVVELLLKHGADPKALVNKRLQTAIDVAVQAGYPGVIEVRFF